MSIKLPSFCCTFYWKNKSRPSETKVAYK